VSAIPYGPNGWPRKTVVLEEGMTFAVEPLIWIPGVAGGGGVRLEDTIVVGADGGRPLTRTAFDARLLLGGRPAADAAGRTRRAGQAAAACLDRRSNPGTETFDGRSGTTAASAAFQQT
jgi:hypothetical protein